MCRFGGNRGRSGSAKIESGVLSLTNAAEVGGQIRKEEKRRKKALPASDKLALIRAVENISTRECQRRLSRELPEVQEVAREKTQVLRDEMTLIQFAADPELMKMLDRLKELLAHKNFDGRYDVLFKEIAAIALKKLEPKATFGAVPHGAPQVDRPLSAKRSRVVRVTVKRVALERAENRCEYVDPLTGRRCDSRHGLELDHIVRFADGGGGEIENICVLCDAHNRWREFTPNRKDQTSSDRRL